MSAPLTTLGRMPVAEFMSKYWQKEPVLLRDVFEPDFCPLSGDDVLELACAEEADCRLILAAEFPPELHHGPFEPDELAELPDSDWSVLVQEADRLHAGAGAVLNLFRFLPNWRVDDLMVSWSAPGGGVGAHTDQYDVFLVQGLGRRRWEIDRTPNPSPVWRPDSEVAVLADFEPTDEWELEPGDVLYLPPHVAHNGVALTDCMTLSVGFRAPSSRDLLESILGYLTESGGGSAGDVAAGYTEDPGLVSEEVLSSLRQRVRTLLGDDLQLDTWLSRALSEPVRGRFGGLESPDLRPGIRVGGVSAAQMMYLVAGTDLKLCVAGQVWSLSHSLRPEVQALCGPLGLRIRAEMGEEIREVLDELNELGLLREL